MSSALFAQTQFHANAMNIYDAPYGLVAQIWNPSNSGETIFVDEILVQGSLEGTFSGMITFAVGLSNIEQPGCQSTSVMPFDGVSTTLVRVSQQPCVINGQPYSISNYTPTNIKILQQCWGTTCKFDRSYSISPGFGITVYVASFLSPTDYVHGFPGYAAVNFYWHNHNGCPSQPNNMMCIQ